MPGPLFNLFKPSTVAPNTAFFVQQKENAGLIVTAELDKALEDCKTKVARIAKDYRAKNRKFRDIEFDLENDKDRCLNGLGISGDENYNPSDCQRVTEIFDNPQFFIDGADSNDIVQGAIGDCWFVSALATMSTAEGLVEKFCVARDEQVGVYGFIFFRDNRWVSVVIDDILFTAIPKYEELSAAEKALYHNDKVQYNNSARKGSKTLYFAQSGTQGETWVPLLEKAYAKLHGSYAALSGGEACEAIEDLTGGVSSFIATRDILDVDQFWKDELLKANKDRLFGCAYGPLDISRSGDYHAKISGLISNHAYSVLRAVEVKDKRFVVVRNPWGASEWTGPWSDGAKEWTAEWLAVLPLLGHSFGDDGEFVMEYKDFLDCWDQIDRTILFDSSWALSSQWLHVQSRPLPSAWAHGDVSFTISLPKASPAMIVLSQLDTRYYDDISGRCHWTFDFIIFKKGEKDPISESLASRMYARSVNVEVNLEAGDYVVHVRLDRTIRREKRYFENNSDGWDQRKLSRILTERGVSQSIAMNFKADSVEQHLPIPLDLLAGQDLAELEAKALVILKEKQKVEKAEAKAKAAAAEAKQKIKDEAERLKEEKRLAEEAAKKPAEDATPADGTKPVEDAKAADGSNPVDAKPAEADEKDEGTQTEAEKPSVVEAPTPAATVTTTTTASGGSETTTTTTLSLLKSFVTGVTGAGGTPVVSGDAAPANDAAADSDDEDEEHVVDPKRDIKDLSEDDSVFLGLRVYTNRDSPAVIGGQLRHEMELSTKLAL